MEVFGSEFSTEDIFILLVFILLIIMIRYLPRKIIQAKSNKTLADLATNLTDNNIDPTSGELINDIVSLDEATYIKVGKEEIQMGVYILPYVSAEQKNEFNSTGYPVKLGYFFRDGWTAAHQFYLFFCISCLEFKVDYKHSHQPYLRCGFCEINYPFHWFLKKS